MATAGGGAVLLAGELTAEVVAASAATPGDEARVRAGVMVPSLIDLVRMAEGRRSVFVRTRAVLAMVPRVAMRLPLTT